MAAENHNICNEQNTCYTEATLRGAEYFYCTVVIEDNRARCPATDTPTIWAIVANASTFWP